MRGFNQKGSAVILIIVCLLIVTGLSAASYYVVKSKPVQSSPTQQPTPSPVACTLEAKLCPDGSYVSRQGHRCEFAPCPASPSATPRISSADDYMTYTIPPGWKKEIESNYGHTIRLTSPDFKPADFGEVSSGILIMMRASRNDTQVTIDQMIADYQQAAGSQNAEKAAIGGLPALTWRGSYEMNQRRYETIVFGSIISISIIYPVPANDPNNDTEKENKTVIDNFIKSITIVSKF